MVSRFPAFAALFAVLCLSPLQGAVYVWDGGGGDNNWSTAANWDSDPTPFDNTDDLQFDGTTRLTPTVDGTPTINSITFNAGAGSFSISGNAITFSGTTPSITQSDDSAQSISSSIVLGGDLTVDGSGTGMLTLSGAIVDSGGARSLTKSGTSDLTLAATNTYTGTTTINAGQLIYTESNSSSAISLGNTSGSDDASLIIALDGKTLNTDIVVNAGSSGQKTIGSDLNSTSWSEDVTYQGTITLNDDVTFSANNQSVTIVESVISGGGDLTVDGNTSGIINITGANTYSGDTTISSGILLLGHEDGLGDTGGVTNTTISSGGELKIQNAGSLTIDNENFSIAGLGYNNEGSIYVTAGSHTITGDISITGHTIVHTVGDLTLSGDISSTGAFTLSAIGSGTLYLSGNNSYSGQTSIYSNGIVEVQHVNALGDTGSDTTTLVASGQTLALNVAGTIDNEIFQIGGNGWGGAGAIDHKGAVDTTLAGTITLSSSSTIDVSDANGKLTLAGVVSGAHSLTKTGAGILELTASNTYSGDTTITSGTLMLGASDVLADASDLVLNGGTLLTDGNSDTLTNLTLTDDSVIDFGTDGTGTLTFTGAVDTSTFVLSIWNWQGDPWNTGNTKLIFSGDTSLVDYDNVVFYKDSGTTLWSSVTGVPGAMMNGTEVLPAVPETSTLIVSSLLAGMLLFESFRRYRRQGAAQVAQS